MEKTFLKELDLLIWKFIKIADDLSNKFQYSVRFIGIRKVTSNSISVNFLYEYGYPIASKIRQIDIPLKDLGNIDKIVSELCDNEPILK
ncbi:MAG: hypothetical protein J1F35_05640 [Erysipelotrichales bacterium]|nr:hypothetical protein [Erysipelotrichales bacterium]